MKRESLSGRDHQKIGAIDVVGDGETALAISQGGARKAYHHTDPNEDAAGFARGSHGVLLCVADGHRGHEAAALAVRVLLERFAESWTGPDALNPQTWWDDACETFVAINDAVLLEAGHGDRTPRTTLSVAVARPGEDLLLVASIGDSHVFKGHPETSVDLTAWSTEHDQPHFLGVERETPASIRPKCFTTAEPLSGALAIVLATDGLSEFAVGVDDPESAVTDAVARGATADAELRALSAARELTAIACEAHQRNPSGDNIATAVAWIGPGKA